MRKFGTVFKEKQIISEQIVEKKLLNEFEKVYAELLEQYRVAEFYDLDKKTQNAFLRELNEYWSEETGLSENGKRFLKTKSTLITESSTAPQKRNYLKKKATTVISEALRQSDLKSKLYSIIDEMYKSAKAKKLEDVLPASAISGTLLESFGESIGEIMTEIVYEITDGKK